MIRRLFLLGLLLLETSFSGASERPDWINNVGSSCKKSQLCAVGSGESRNLAKASATGALVRIFETEVKVVFETELSVENGKEEESGNERITQKTELALQGVQHPKVHEGKELYYALAVINKRKAARVFEQELKKLDDEILGLLGEERTGAFLTIEEKLKERTVISKRYTFLSGFDKKAPISLKDFYEKKRKATKGIIVHLFIDEERPKKIEPYIGQLLTDSGYSLTKGKLWKKESTHLLKGSLKWEKEFLKVKGFEKYKFSLNLYAENRRRVKSGSLSLSHSQTGRSFIDARSRALVEIKKKVKDQLSSLSFQR